LRDGDLERAERIARIHADRLTFDGREALVVIAHVAVLRGRLDEAAALLDDVEPLLVGDGESITARDRVTRARAALRAARGDVSGALSLLDAQVARCAAGGLVHFEIQDAGFAAVLAAATDPADARRRADAILPRARALGYRRTVRDVEAALARR
jgi:ATP/maltotriose-dependent transcriptional regulator MalT